MHAKRSSHSCLRDQKAECNGRDRLCVILSPFTIATIRERKRRGAPLAGSKSASKAVSMRCWYLPPFLLQVPKKPRASSSSARWDVTNHDLKRGWNEARNWGARETATLGRPPSTQIDPVTETQTDTPASGAMVNVARIIDGWEGQGEAITCVLARNVSRPTWLVLSPIRRPLVSCRRSAPSMSRPGYARGYRVLF